MQLFNRKFARKMICGFCETDPKHAVMPQSHPTTVPVRFVSFGRFLARKAEWSARRNFTSVLFPWSHQATGPVRPDTSAYLWFGWMIRRTLRVPRAMPVRASCGPRTGIFNVFRILRDPYGARAGPARVPLRTRKGIDTTIMGNHTLRASYLAARGPYGPLTVPTRAVHGLFTISKPVRGS